MRFSGNSNGCLWITNASFDAFDALLMDNGKPAEEAKGSSIKAMQARKKSALVRGA